jgi:hypothetical protein
MPVTVGFFFPHQKCDNTNTIQKLTDAGRQTLVFVQLFQNIAGAEKNGSGLVSNGFTTWTVP